VIRVETISGADVVMTTSALLRHGAGHIQILVDGLKGWLAARDLETLGRIQA